MQFIYLIILGVLAGIVAAVASMAGLLPFGLSPVSGQYDQYGGPGDDRFWLLVLLLKGDAGKLGGSFGAMPSSN